MTYRHLSVEEREAIQLGMLGKESIRSIAKGLGRSPSAIAREIARNLPLERRIYTPRLAHERAVEYRKHRGRIDRLKNDRIRAYTIRHLKKRWSPEQIAGRIRHDYGEHISHEAIYQFVYAQIHRNGYGDLKPECMDLRQYLRRRRKRRVPHGTRKTQRVCRPHGTSIDLRPVIVDRRLRIGDWEGDTVASRDNRPGINTLVERKTGLVLITRLGAKTSAATKAAIIQRLGSVPINFRHTLTLDNGSENQQWRAIELGTSVRCFFAHPYHSWERGTNENTNGLIREYFPKKTDFDMVRDDDIRNVEWNLNTRPRKRLDAYPVRSMECCT